MTNSPEDFSDFHIWIEICKSVWEKAPLEYHNTLRLVSCSVSPGIVLGFILVALFICSHCVITSHRPWDYNTSQPSCQRLSLRLFMQGLNLAFRRKVKFCVCVCVFVPFPCDTEVSPKDWVFMSGRQVPKWKFSEVMSELPATSSERVLCRLVVMC